jgi:hypothetical protein
MLFKCTYCQVETYFNHVILGAYFTCLCDRLYRMPLKEKKDDANAEK